MANGWWNGLCQCRSPRLHLTGRVRCSTSKPRLLSRWPWTRTGGAFIWNAVERQLAFPWTTTKTPQSREGVGGLAGRVGKPLVQTAGGRELGARRSPACSFYLAANFPDLTSKARNRSLGPEDVSLFERHPPHFSTVSTRQIHWRKPKRVKCAAAISWLVRLRLGVPDARPAGSGV